ncbi:hypothetical protein EBB59_08955 [Lysobacter pythonis]|uniref:Secreted protein n=1 Tax=Solilutibacter pythonis TaxID=2483112 RepID=A0A3M2HY05_9GAMM|nr:DUF6607 family protein [Lysobacter pythonis]RMH91057.1 hypothetical protein EBB59_08955 [Lysobacter pythonis]
MSSLRCLPALCVAFFASTAAAEAPKGPAGADRDAILAMQGEYQVDFAFDETVLIAPGYARAPAQRSGGDEVVIVVEDSARRIVLQHLLVDAKSGHVTKHWRQDWEYEAPKRFEFSADQTWRMRAIPAALTRGAWTQCVYEVNDAPRYCGTGRWRHRDGVATWVSDRVWRPLPRREHTRRSDYNAMHVENRHTIVAGGWTHEQDNTKTVRRADGGEERSIAREFGFNDYRKTAEIDFGPAYRYWRATAPYWSRVRARWRQALESGGLRLATKIDGMALIMPLFQQAEQARSGKPVAEPEIEAQFQRWVKPLPPAAGARAAR